MGELVLATAITTAIDLQLIIVAVAQLRLLYILTNVQKVHFKGGSEREVV